MNKLQKWLIDAFPAPKYLTMPAVAIDISPNSVKYLEGKYASKGCLPQKFNEIFLEKGTIEDGSVKDVEAFTKALKKLQRKNKYKFAFVSIPENALYLYTMRLKGLPSHSSIAQQIEFAFSEHVPIALKDAVYDYSIIDTAHNVTTISVTVAPVNLITTYEQVLNDAGFLVRSIELEAYAISRAAVSNSVRHHTEMIVDVGYERAGVIVVKNGLPIFTATVQGGSKNPQMIIEECKKQYTFWDTRTDSKGRRIERISNVTLCGGGASKNLKELLSNTLGKKVVMANVWQNLFDIDDYIPEIDAKESLSMTTLAGLLLNNKV